MSGYSAGDFVADTRPRKETGIVDFTTDSLLTHC